MIIFRMNNSMLFRGSRGSPTSCTFLLQERHLSIGQNKISIDFFPKWDTSIGIILTFSSTILIKSLRDVFLTKRLGVSLHSVMIKLVVDTLVLKRRQKKFCSVSFIGPIFSKMPMSFASVVIDVNNWVESLRKIWCHYNRFWQSNFLMCGASISWDLSQKIFGNLYILVVVDYVSKWVEDVHAKLMTTRLLSSFSQKISSHHSVHHELL